MSVGLSDASDKDISREKETCCSRMREDCSRLDLIRYRSSRLAFLFLSILISATFVVSRPFVFTVATIFTLVAVSRGKPGTLEIILSLRKDIFRR